MATTKTTHAPKNTTAIAQQVHELREMARELEARAALVETRLARGTGDVTAAARAAAAAPTPPSRTPKVDRLTDAMRAQRARATQTATSYFVGDEGPTPELIAVVERAIAERPRTLNELVEITGARRNRLSGVMVRLQHAGKPVENLGTDQRALWFIRRRPGRATGRVR
jgi:hypothetical protein